VIWWQDREIPGTVITKIAHTHFHFSVSVYCMFILSTIIRVIFLPIWHMHSQTSPSNTWECRHQGNIIQQWDEVKGH